MFENTRARLQSIVSSVEKLKEFDKELAGYQEMAGHFEELPSLIKAAEKRLAEVEAEIVTRQAKLENLNRQIVERAEKVKAQIEALSKLMVG